MSRSLFIEETRIGNWFLNSHTWKVHVLRRALNDLERMIPKPLKTEKILDVGCGFGHSFKELNQRFSPKEIVALDADPAIEKRTRAAAKACPCKITLTLGNASQLDFADNSFDMIYCHQTFHHIVDQASAIQEFFRVLKPGGVLLFAESTRRYIYSIPIRLLFRHPMEVQKTAPEYLTLIEKAGFELSNDRISMPYLWWSRPDMGLLEWLGFPVPEKREETLVNLVALKPVQH